MTIATEYALSTVQGKPEAIRIGWGLVQIPVRLHIVTDGGSSVPKRSMFSPDGNPVGQKNYDKVTGKDVAADTITKKVVVGDKLVELTDDEIAAHCTGTKGLADIVTFIPMSSIGTMYAAERVGAWTPDTITVGKVKMVDPAAAKASALLRAAMARRDEAALVLVPTKGGGKYVALCPDGTAITFSFAEYVRPIIDVCDEVEVTEAELAMADALIDSIGTSTPVLTDETGDRIRTYLTGKAEGTAVVVTLAPVTAPEVDLMGALAASLAAQTAKAKPAAKAKAPAAKRKAS